MTARPQIHRTINGELSLYVHRPHGGRHGGLTDPIEPTEQEAAVVAELLARLALQSCSPKHDAATAPPAPGRHAASQATQSAANAGSPAKPRSEPSTQKD
ncbi:MAG: hypothetical protein ACREP7_04600 [Lysobacter sp.]